MLFRSRVEYFPSSDEGVRVDSQPLSAVSLQAVLSVHDTVAQKNFDPVLPPLPDDFEDELEEESVKIVRLVKNKEPLVSQEGCSSSTGRGGKYKHGRMCDIVGGQMAERLGNPAINQKVAVSIPGVRKMTLCPWARRFTLLALGGMSLYLL